MAKLLKSSDGMLIFECPGCGRNHGVYVKQIPHAVGPEWGWNGDYDKPTFTPSILVQGETRCHMFVESGKIRYLRDCQHQLAGKTIDMIDLD